MWLFVARSLARRCLALKIFVNTICRNRGFGSQGRGSLDAELAVEDKDRLPSLIPAYARSRFGQAGSQEQFFYRSRSIDIDSARDMSTIIFIIEPAVYHMEVGDKVVILAIHESIQLQQNSINTN